MWCCCEQSLFTIGWQCQQFPDGCSSSTHSPLGNHCLWARHPLYLQLLWLAAVEDGVSAQSLPDAEWVLVCVWPSLTLRLLPEAITVNKNVFSVKLLGGIISLFYLHCFCAHTFHQNNNIFVLFFCSVIWAISATCMLIDECHYTVVLIFKTFEYLPEFYHYQRMTLNIFLVVHSSFVLPRLCTEMCVFLSK